MKAERKKLRLVAINYAEVISHTNSPRPYIALNFLGYKQTPANNLEV